MGGPSKILQAPSHARIPCDLTGADAKRAGDRRSISPDDIRPRGIDQLDQSPSTCPVPVCEEERDHAGYELPIDIHRDQPCANKRRQDGVSLPALYE